MPLIMLSTKVLLYWWNDTGTMSLLSSSKLTTWTSSNVNLVKCNSSLLWLIFNTGSEEGMTCLSDYVKMTRPSCMNFTFWWREDGMVPASWIQGQSRNRLKDDWLEQHGVSDWPNHNVCSKCTHNTPLSPIISFNSLCRRSKIRWGKTKSNDCNQWINIQGRVVVQQDWRHSMA